MLTKDTQLCMSLAARPGNFGTLFQNYLYQKLGLNYIYKAFTTNHLGDAIRGIRALGIRGCAISMPYKEACIPLLDELDHSAATIQSVNTIVNTKGVLKGYNTDYVAIEQLLLKHQIDRSIRFAVKGNGGMAKAVLAALYNNGYHRGVVVTRREKVGRELALAYGYAHQVDTQALQVDMLINATPLGMEGGAEAEELAFRPSEIAQAQIVFDVVALPVQTPLLKEALRQQKQVISGADVAVIQSLEQFVRYTGVRPDSDLILEAQAYTRAKIKAGV